MRLVKNCILLSGLLFASLQLQAQTAELSAFQQALTHFVNYDLGKIDSLPKSAATTSRLQKAMDDAFGAFVVHKDSKDLAQLKKSATPAGRSWVIDNRSYFFDELRRDMYSQATENNLYYGITFYGFYDYELSNFVSFFIQPFKVGGKDYVAYSYSLNGAGTFYIKDAGSNLVVFKLHSLTSNAALAGFHQIDLDHVLLVEDMGDNGQRAVVVQTTGGTWKTINSFKGSAFPDNATTYTKKSQRGPRTYLRYASAKKFKALYGFGFLKEYVIRFDEASGTISYKLFNGGGGEAKTIRSKWTNASFTIDDYYIGEQSGDVDIPMPD